MNTTRPDWWEVNIGLDNGLVLSGNKPSPEPNVYPDDVAI